MPSDADAPAWLTSMVEYEGFPLALRVRPTARMAALRATHLHLGTLTHELAEVTTRGLPVPAYNDSPAEFDHAIHVAVESGGEGTVFIVKTFAGKRIYYFCLADESVVQDQLAAALATFPQHECSYECQPNAAWEFYDSYREQFHWE